MVLQFSVSLLTNMISKSFFFLFVNTFIQKAFSEIVFGSGDKMLKAIVSSLSELVFS